MMRKRGIILLLGGALALAYNFCVFAEVRKSPFGYEFGSVAFPVPTHLRVIGVFGIFATIAGLLLTALDFSRWLKTR